MDFTSPIPFLYPETTVLSLEQLRDVCLLADKEHDEEYLVIILAESNSQIPSVLLNKIDTLGTHNKIRIRGKVSIALGKIFGDSAGQ